MTTTTRLAAAVAAVLVSVVTLQMIANYALPPASAVQLASAKC